MIHFIWNFIGSIILGSVSLVDDYPAVLQITYSGKKFLTGGIYKLEGSIIS